MSNQGKGTSPQPTAQLLAEAARKRRLNKRRGKGGDGDVTYLNITPMLDLMTVILIFLLKSFAASASNVTVENLTLPHSTTKLEVTEALQLMITEKEILLDQKVIMELDERGAIKLEDLPDGANGYLVKPLYDALADKADYFKRIEEYGGETFVGRVAIISDKKTAYKTIFKILYTSGRAEFGLFKLFVQKPEG